MEIKGYKAFNSNLTNRYGKPFIEGKVYHIDGTLKFGNDGNGFHFCKRLEDTLRYFPAMEEEITIALVTALGDVSASYDDYYGYYDMYCTSTIRIDHIMSREEIIKMYLNLPEERVERFIAGYKLTKDEIELFRIRYKTSKKILNAISYYQEKDLDVYSRELTKKLCINRK